jgi:hypothetical protein
LAVPGAAPAPAGTASTTAVAGSTSGAAAPLPALESLTIDSDYSPFMQPGVDDAMKRGALKKLFSDPHFNVMDGLDVYIGDYSKPDPIDPAIVRTLTQARYIFNPPATRVNAAGYVEDVPDDAAADDAAAPADAAPAPPADGIAVARADPPLAVPPPTAATDVAVRIDESDATPSVDADGKVAAAKPATSRT